MNGKNVKAASHKVRLMPLHVICLRAFRHLILTHNYSVNNFDRRQLVCEIFIQIDEKSNCASAAQSLYGVALRTCYKRPVRKPPKHRLTRLFCAMLCQIFLKYIQYSCKNLTLPDTKNPESFGTSTVLEQI